MKRGATREGCCVRLVVLREEEGEVAIALRMRVRRKRGENILILVYNSFDNLV